MKSELSSHGVSDATLRKLTDVVRERYSTFKYGLPFHGWHHVVFVREQAVALAHRNGADVAIVEAAAILHDLNYMVARNSRAGVGRDLRQEILGELGVAEPEVQWIERVVREAETEARNGDASLEAQALSDADTIFKALPITPVMLAHRYMDETGQNLRQLCDRIIRDQVRLLDQGIYFYDDDVRKRYEEWAESNLRLWQCVNDSLALPQVRDLVEFLEQDKEAPC